MAFLGVIGTLALLAFLGFLVLLVSIAPIIIGTVIVRKTQHKKLGVAIRIYGYIAFIPVWAGALYAFVTILKHLASG
ncbi:MAG: hypothetical protein IJO29_05075 [Oscillospiraceae bacterium]|nr:hypothetical protein [Oscillospiraceae bacterium]